MTTSIANEPDFEPSPDGSPTATPTPPTSHASVPTMAGAPPSWAADATIELTAVDPPAAGAYQPDPVYPRGQAGYPPPGYQVPGYPPHPGYPPPNHPPPGYLTYPGAGSGWAPPNGFTGPSAWPIAIFTVFFGLFGAISAARRSRDARALGLPAGRYWWVFGGSLVGSFVLWTVSLGIFVAIAVPIFVNSTTVMNADQLEVQLMKSSAGGVTVTQADCVDDLVDASGTGTYRCRLTFADGVAQSYTVTVHDDGTWAASTPG